MATARWAILLSLFKLLPLLHSQMVETIECNDEWTLSNCSSQTISCNSSASICNINCNADGSCEGSTISCGSESSSQCIIQCNGDYSCRGAVRNSIVNCPANAQCEVHCNGLNSCGSMIVNCPSNSNCTLHANAKYALVDARIHCGAGHCLAYCMQFMSCSDTMFDARFASRLSVDCENYQNACKNMKVACPQSRPSNTTKVCKLTGDLGTEQSEMKIFAVDSWDDIDLTRYVAITSHADEVAPQMYCDADYKQSCDVSLSSWNCDDTSSPCYRENIPAFPTPKPTTAPVDGGSSERDEISDVQRVGFIIAIIIGCIFFCFCMLLGYVWCVKRMKETEEKYEELDQSPHRHDPDADIMEKQSNEGDQRMYKKTASGEVVTKDGFHIVADYSDANVFGGLMPISEESSGQVSMGKSNVSSVEKTDNDDTPNGNDVEEEAKETEQLIASEQPQTNVVVAKTTENGDK